MQYAPSTTTATMLATLSGKTTSDFCPRATHPTDASDAMTPEPLRSHETTQALRAACCGVVSVRVPGGMCHRNAAIWPLGPGGIRLESGRILDVAPQRSGSAACPDRDVAMTAGNGLSRRALPSGEELVPAARNGWI